MRMDAKISNTWGRNRSLDGRFEGGGRRRTRIEVPRRTVEGADDFASMDELSGVGSTPRGRDEKSARCGPHPAEVARAASAVAPVSGSSGWARI